MLYGNQTPTFEFYSTRAKDFSDSVRLERFMAKYGGHTQLDDWQKRVIRQFLARDKDGKFAHQTCALSAPRQNGKSAIIEVLVLYKLIFLNESIIITSQLTDTNRNTFARICSYFENPDFPELQDKLKVIRKAHGQLAIEMKSGAKAYFQARNDKAGRGKTVDTIIADEAQEFSDDANAALLPTISSRPNPQSYLLGTPETGTSNSEVFAKVRETAHKKNSKIIAYAEWAADLEDDPTDPRVWARTNPAMGYRIQQSTIETELASYKDERRFQIERLGVWFGHGGEPVIDEQVWANLTDELSEPVEELVLSFDISPKRTSATIAIAGKRADGLIHVEITDHRAEGTAWLVPRIKELASRHKIRTVVFDDASHASSFEDQLLRIKGLRIKKTNTKEATAACGVFFDAVQDGTLRHISQPPLNDAIGFARKRNLAGAWAWARATGGGDIAPLIAVTNAYWAVQSKKVRKTKASSHNGTESKGRAIRLR